MTSFEIISKWMIQFRIQTGIVRYCDYCVPKNTTRKLRKHHSNPFNIFHGSRLSPFSTPCRSPFQCSPRWHHSHRPIFWKTHRSSSGKKRSPSTICLVKCISAKLARCFLFSILFPPVKSAYPWHLAHHFGHGPLESMTLIRWGIRRAEGQTRGIRRVELLLIALRPDDAHAELLFRLSQLYKKQEEGTWNVSNSQIPTWLDIESHNHMHAFLWYSGIKESWCMQLLVEGLMRVELASTSCGPCQRGLTNVTGQIAAQPEGPHRRTNAGSATFAGS